MNEITVLQNGYCKVLEGENSFIADCTITLIKSHDVGCILVDTSGPWNKQNVINVIQAQGISLADIKTVVCTHGHSDHIGNLNLFPHAKLIVGHDISKGNIYEDFDFKKMEQYKLSSDVEVIPTPGHMNHDVSVVVRNTSLGTVVIAGDLFENEEDLNDTTIWKNNSENPTVQEENRRKVLKIANYIIPGHGAMFCVEKKLGSIE